MNPFERARRDQYNAIRQTIAAVSELAQTEGRELTEAERAHVRSSEGQLEQIAAELALDETEHQRSASVAELANRVSTGDAGFTGVGGAQPAPAAELGVVDVVPALMPGPVQLAEMLRTVTEGQTAHRWTVDQPELHTRATLTTAQVGVGVASAGAQPLREPRRISTAVPLPVERVAGVEGLAFPVFGAGTADVDTEGTTKQEYAAVTPGSATPQMIAVWTDFTRQAALSMTSFEARLRGKHAALVAKREDVLMVSRLSGVVGAQTYVGATGSTPDYSDSLLAACGLVLASDVAAAPDIILVNPADLPLIYPAAITHGINGTAPDSAMRLELHGAVVYPTAAVSAGSAIVAALGASARFVVGLPPTVMVDAMSGLKTNTITSLMEEAVTLAIDEPSGVVLVDLVPPAA
ncbi:MAG: hypothetical protein JHC71_13030 [Blastococcus sp.]|nr:hypothetical protein [Blastococcus sp.]